MGIVSLEKMDHLYWLGRYTERVYTTLRVFSQYYDVMIDQNEYAYEGYCKNLAIPNIYKGKANFTDSYLFEETNPDSVYSNLQRAFDNGVVIRESLSSTALAYIQMSLDLLRTARGSKAPLMDLQMIIDYLLAFWGAVDDFVEDEYTRDMIKCGKYVERLDLYLRFSFPARELEKEMAKLINRMEKVHAGQYVEKMKKLGELFETDADLKENRVRAIQLLESTDEKIVEEQLRTAFRE